MTTDTCAPAPTTPAPANLTAAVSVARTLNYAAQNSITKALADAVTTAITEKERLEVTYLLDPPVAFVHTDGRLMAACEVYLTRLFAAGASDTEDVFDTNVRTHARPINEDGTFVVGLGVTIEVPPELADLYDPDNAEPAETESDESPNICGVKDCNINHTATPVAFTVLHFQ